MDKIEQNHKDTVHYILVHSYLIFLFTIILGVIFDTFLKDKIFSNDVYKYIGFIMLFVSSIIILWAQVTSHNYKSKSLSTKVSSHFERGPYKYLRNPTHLSVFILALGFGLIINSFFSIVFTIIAYIVTKIFFLKKEEQILEHKYGDTYTEYKKKVKNWI